jgi:tRNA-binding EMAP/Myf-like protein
VEAGYINFFLSVSFYAGVIDAVLERGFVSPLPKKGDKVMIEYSQPNTHKAFHVGHMRNAALGDALVRLWEFIGHPVVAVNYFGDEGAHVAKCLWYFKKYYLNHKTLADVPKENRGEFLGDFYSKSVEMLDLSTLTSMPYLGVYAAQVEAIGPHPNADAPKNWHLVTVNVGEKGKFQVVCGGSGYNVGDVVAYVPVGAKFNKKTVEPKDMMGVQSHGIMLATRELAGAAPEDAAPEEEEVRAVRQGRECRAGLIAACRMRRRAPRRRAATRVASPPVTRAASLPTRRPRSPRAMLSRRTPRAARATSPQRTTRLRPPQRPTRPLLPPPPARRRRLRSLRPAPSTPSASTSSSPPTATWTGACS